MASVVALAHAFVCQHSASGGHYIDATAGNGHDTLLLAHRAGEKGAVFAFDIQQRALDSTRLRLESAGLHSRVTLIKASHEHMKEHLPSCWAGTVHAVMFNLGWLPGADHGVTTRAASTVLALNAALDLLSDRGCLSVVAYPGHPAGMEELEALRQWAYLHESRWCMSWAASGNPLAPVLITARRPFDEPQMLQIQV